MLPHFFRSRPSRRPAVLRFEALESRDVPTVVIQAIPDQELPRVMPLYEKVARASGNGRRPAHQHRVAA